MPPSPLSIAAQLHNVSMSFDGFASLAVSDICVEIGRGEIFGIIGPEGSGKSTILLLLAGRVRAMEGKVRVFGRSPRWSAIRARIGFLPQTSRGPHRAGAIASLWGKLRKLSVAQEKPAPALPNSVRLARLLLRKPDLLVLDEPFSGLAGADLVEMSTQIRALARQGQTVILSDRSLAPAKEVCDRMAILYRGQVQAVGALPQLLAAPEAIRILGPVLPAAGAEKVLTTMREALLDGARAAVTLPPTRPAACNSENGGHSDFTSLAQPSLATEQIVQGSKPDNMVDYEKLAQLTKPAIEKKA